MRRFQKPKPDHYAKTLGVEIYALILENEAGHAWVDKVALPNCGDETLASLHQEADMHEATDDTRAMVVCFKGEIAIPQRLPRPIPQINLVNPSQSVMVAPDFDKSDSEWYAKQSAKPQSPKIHRPTHKRKAAV